MLFNGLRKQVRCVGEKGWFLFILIVELRWVRGVHSFGVRIWCESLIVSSLEQLPLANRKGRGSVRAQLRTFRAVR
jgi:hypothetical protein